MTDGFLEIVPLHPTPGYISGMHERMSPSLSMYYFPDGLRELSTFLDNIVFSTVRCSIPPPTLHPSLTCCLYINTNVILSVVVDVDLQNLLAGLGSSLPGSCADGLPKGFHSKVSPTCV